MPTTKLLLTATNAPPSLRLVVFLFFLSFKSFHEQS
jgi:hypothetical protein